MIKRYRYKVIILILFLLILFYFRSEIQELDIQKFISEIEQPYYLPGAIIILFILKSVIFFLPLKIIMISSGMFLPLYIALIINFFGYLFEISITFLIGNFFGEEFVEDLIQKFEKFEKILDYKSKNEFDLTFVLRLVPVAVEPVSLFMGASGNKLISHNLASMMGMFPKILIYTFIGNLVLSQINLIKIILNLVLFFGWLLMINKFKLQNTFNRLYNNI